MRGNQAITLSLHVFISLTACQTLPTFSGAFEPSADVQISCEQSALSFYIRGSNPGAEVSNNQVVPPKVTLVGADTFDTVATWDDAEKAVLVTVAGLEAGTYTVRIDRFSDHEVREIPQAIVVKKRPVVSQTRFNALCTTGSGKDVVLVGQHLADTEVTLAEGGLVLPAAVSFDGTELTVTLPSNAGTIGSKVVLRVSSAPECHADTTDERSVDVTGPPAIEFFSVSPTLATLDASLQPRRTEQVAIEDEIKVQIKGTSLVSGTAVSLVGADGSAVLASRVALDGDYLDAYFAKNTLSAGIKSLRVDVGGCAVDQASALEAVSIGTTLAIKGVWQNTLTLKQDLRQTLVVELENAPAADAGLRFAIAVNDGFLALDNLDTLDKARKLRRLYRSPSFEEVPAGFYDLYAFSRAANGAVSVGVLRNALWINNELSALSVGYIYPRTLSASAGGALHVAGCGFGQLGNHTYAKDVRFELERDDGLVVPLTATRATSGSNWASARFDCGTPEPGQQASGSTAFIPIAAGALQPGRYVVRAIRTIDAVVTKARSLYTLSVLSDAPVVSAFADAGMTLAVARRAPSSAVVADKYGRLFAYVIGGDANDDANPIKLSPPSTHASYEFSPIDPTDNSLLGFVPRGSSTEWPLDYEEIGTPFPYAYGSATIEDGSLLRFAGGTSDGTTAASDSAYSRTLEIHPNVRASLVRFESLGNIDAVLGDYLHYRFVVLYATNWETVVQQSGPTLSVKLAGKSARLNVNPGCHTNTAKPAVIVYRAQSGSPIPSDDLDFRQVNGAAQTFATCAGGEILDGAITPTAASPRFPSIGALQPLTRENWPIGPSGSYFGAQGVMAYSRDAAGGGFEGNLVILGGVRPHANVAERTLLAGDNLYHYGTNSDPGFSQAFATKPIVQMTAAGRTFLSPFGIQAATGQQIFSMAAAHDVAPFTAPTLTTLTSAPLGFDTHTTYYGGAAFDLGRSILLVNGFNGLATLPGVTPTDKTMSFSGTVLSGNGQGQLRALSGSFSSGAKLWISGGFVCSSTANECAMNSNTRQLTNTVLTATVAP